jgi:hypothetical protein
MARIAPGFVPQESPEIIPAVVTQTEWPERAIGAHVFSRAEEGCPHRCPALFVGQGGEFDFLSYVAKKASQNPRPVATNATRTEHPPPPDVMIWLANHVVGAQLHLHCN